MDAAPQPAPPAAVFPLIRDSDHKYFVGNRNLEGVTEIMVDNRLESDEWYTETHSSRGTAIHAELANAARGIPPFPFIDPDLYGWCQSGRDYLAYLIADGAIILAVEKMLYSPLYWFAGTVDLVVLWRGYEWVLDWKSGKASKVTRFKLAAYDLLMGPTQNGKPRKRAAIEVHEDGSRAKIVEYNGSDHFHDGNTFLALLTATRARKLYGPKDY